MNGAVSALRDRRLRALGIEPLRLRTRAAAASTRTASAAAVVSAAPAPPVAGVAEVPERIARLALHADPAERLDPAIDRMYTALTEAVGKAGLQSVRVCDVADDPAAAVMVFGAASPPPGVSPERVLRVDSLVALHADRERKRLLWERMQALGRGGGG